MGRNTALLIIDVQFGMFESPLIPPVSGGAELISTIRGLIGGARASRVPVIYVQHSGGSDHPLEHGTPGWQIHPLIAPLDGETVIHKRTPDSFHDTLLQHELEARQIKKLVVVGIQTEFCVDTTCRRAFSLGYDVALIKDGHSTWDKESLTARQIIAHHNEILGGWFARLREASSIKWRE